MDFGIVFAILGISFLAGFISGIILRLSQVIFMLIGAFGFGHTVGQDGLGEYISSLARTWKIGLLVTVSFLPGVAVGYFTAERCLEWLNNP